MAIIISLQLGTHLPQPPSATMSHLQCLVCDEQTSLLLQFAVPHVALGALGYGLGGPLPANFPVWWKHGTHLPDPG